MKHVFLALIAIFVTFESWSCTESVADEHGEDAGQVAETPDETDDPIPPRPEHKGRVVASDDNRFLMYENGAPFFWMADTAWLLTDRMTVEEAREYLERRAEQGFTVIMFSCLGDDYAVENPNYAGETAFLDEDYTVFNPVYFEHVCKIIDIADELGLVVGLLPNWGDKLYRQYGYEIPVLGTPEKAENYGKYIGNLLKDKENVVWVLGGDKSGDYTAELVRAQARGIAIGTSGSEDYSKCTITYHPCGYQTSSTWFHNDEWLDFNMQQNGHGYDNVWDRMSKDYNLTPPKPVLDGEPTYDEHWLNFKKEDGITSDIHCRRYFYHDVFSGACGHTYGTTGIWSFYDPEIPFKYAKEDVPAHSWRESLDLPSGKQMIYGMKLMMSRPYFDRIPDNSFVLDNYDGNQRISATRDKNKTYAMIYSEQGYAIRINTLIFGSGDTVNAWWFNPRDGKAVFIGEMKKMASYKFTPQTNGMGNDWILVIDDPAAGYGEPGGEIWKGNK